MAAVAPAMQTIQLQVPPDGQPGQLIQAQVNGQTVQAQIPPGLQPGATFSVSIPAAAPVDDPAATAAYDALLAGASRLSFSSKSDMANDERFDFGPWSVEADNGAAFQVTVDTPSGLENKIRYGGGNGSYNAQVLMGDVVVQRFSSTGVANGRAAYLRCPRPPASQSIDRGEALTIQVERSTNCEKYKKSCSGSFPDESVRVTRGGGGGLSLVTPPPDKKRCYAAGCCLAGTFFPVACALSIVLAFIPVETGRETYVAYDATGTPLGAKLVVPGQKCACCRNICRPGDPWLDLGATPVAARRDLVAAAVALRCTDSAAYVPMDG